MRMPKLSPVFRMSLGLGAIVISFIFLLDIIGVIPSHQSVTKAVRQRVSENLGVQVAMILRSGDIQELGGLLRDIKIRENDIVSLGLRQTDGTLVAQFGEHERHWKPPSEGRSDIDNIIVPLFANNQPWGNLELGFRELAPWSIKTWLDHPMVAMILVIGVCGVLAFYLYLSRALFYLDPTSAVPERVRRAFDSLREAILIIDQRGTIMLTNTAFQQLHPRAHDNLVGHNISEQTWFIQGLGQDVEYPWAKTMAEGEVSENNTWSLLQPDGSEVKIVVNVSPVHAPTGALRGCLISISNVSELHLANANLRQLVAELSAAHEEIDNKNKELQLLASRDPLTGCFNRRSMFEMMEELYVKAQSESSTFCCIMADIDHFKNFNDRFGHAVGDEVIRSVARRLQSGLRQVDMLFRYGGEEFCILLPDISLEEAAAVAERLRSEIEQHAARSLRTIQDVRVTSSFGVAELAHFMLDPAELVGRADDALYQSKENGRNRVTAWRLESFAAA